MILEVGNLDGLVVLIFLVMLGPPALLLLTGIILILKKKKTAGKVFCILAGVYLLVSLGICGAMLGGY
ncbi:hypothetical protein [Maribacter aestuarii]|uniref:hypothetical protein n=1 Tax=Maribacter aestuarii TaxID=1130723 RepID=UPI0025A5C105|nr:hypothetical protein [Maribacter aestuarii]